MPKPKGKHKPTEFHKLGTGEALRDFILGAQDGIVNVLGLVLGVASATLNTKIILISGLAGVFAESISMGAVAFTSSKAAHDYYKSEVAREKKEIDELPDEEVQEIRDIYHKRGFRGKGLDYAVNTITSNKKVWLDTMMQEELGFSKDEATKNPLFIGVFVFLATLIGSFVPLIPFFFLPASAGIIASVIASGVILFAIGAVKAELTIGHWGKSGLEMLIVGLLAAGAGYLIGKLLNVWLGVPVLP